MSLSRPSNAIDDRYRVNHNLAAPQAEVAICHAAFENAAYSNDGVAGPIVERFRLRAFCKFHPPILTSISPALIEKWIERQFRCLRDPMGIARCETSVLEGENDFAYAIGDKQMR